MRVIYTSLTMVCFTILSTITYAGEDVKFPVEQICKATIAQIMGRNPLIINTKKTAGGVVHLSYIRENDGTRWANRCKVEGNKIIWASETGRWRTHELDPKLTYHVSESVLHIVEVYGDGSSTKGKFTMKELSN